MIMNMIEKGLMEIMEREDNVEDVYDDIQNMMIDSHFIPCEACNLPYPLTQEYDGEMDDGTWICKVCNPKTKKRKDKYYHCQGCGHVFNGDREGTFLYSPVILCPKCAKKALKIGSIKKLLFES